MPIFHKNRQNLQSAKTDKSQQILQDKTTENHSIFCQNLENAVEPKTKKSAFSATKKSTIINKKHPQKNLTSTQTQTQQAPRKKFLKIFAASGLAFFMGVGTLCGVLLAPVTTNLLNKSENATVSQEALAAEIKSYKEDIATGKIKYAPSALGLDPENDPVLWTTETGLEIKQSNSLSNPNLSKYLYVTMGTYNSYAINWLICGLPKVIGETTSPAGAAINAELSKNFYHTSSSAGTNGMYYDTSLAANNFRLVSECVLGQTSAVSLGRVYYLEDVPSGATIVCVGYWGAQDLTCYATYDSFNTTLTNYKNNNTLNLASYVNSGAITQNIYYLSEDQAALLVNKIAYSIGTTTASAWWLNSAAYAGGSAPGYDQRVTRPVLKAVYNVNGALDGVQVGSFSQERYWDSDTYVDYVSNMSHSAGIRLGIVAKLSL